MINVYEGDDVNDAYGLVISDFEQDRAKKVPSRNGMTLELHPAVIAVEHPENCLVTAYGRPTNPAFGLAEVLWILGGRDDVGMMVHYNSTFGQFSDDGATFNAAYGKRIRSSFGFDQLQDVIDGLKLDPESRQAVMAIWSPPHDRALLGWDVDATLADDKMIAQSSTPIKNVTKDRACNLVSNALIRDGKLDWTQTMRSNDVIWGTPNNFMQFIHLQKVVADQVGVELGQYTHQVNSLHMYERHWPDLMRLGWFDLYSALRSRHKAVDGSQTALRHVMQVERVIRIRGTAKATWELSGYWADVAIILSAWSAYKAESDEEAVRFLIQCQDHVYAAAQARFFYWWRWYKQEPENFNQLLSRWPDKVVAWIKDAHN